MGLLESIKKIATVISMVCLLCSQVNAAGVDSNIEIPLSVVNWHFAKYHNEEDHTINHYYDQYDGYK